MRSSKRNDVVIQLTTAQIMNGFASKNKMFLYFNDFFRINNIHDILESLKLSLSNSFLTGANEVETCMSATSFL